MQQNSSQIAHRSVLQRSIALLVATLALVACGGTAAVAPPTTGIAATIATDSKLIGDAGDAGVPQVGAPAPDFQYTMADGTTHTLSELRGKKVLLNFWATWCGPCRSEIPALQQALGEAGNAVVVLGVNKAELTDVIAPFASELKVGFPLITNASGDIAGRYGAQLLPTSYFINSDGTIALRKTGEMDYSFIKTHISQLK